MTTNVSNRRLSRSSGQDIFGIDATGYHAGRIGYPDALYDALWARCDGQPDVLEIGAGTGLATEAVLDRSPRSLTVIEPSASLVAFTAERLRAPQLRFVVGSFPDADLTGPFDLAVCAAAFHWLEPQPALARVRRLLRPDGLWAMWWNGYRNVGIGDPLSDAVTPLLDGMAMPPSEGGEGHYSLNKALHTRTLVDAGFDGVECHQYRRERHLRTDQVLALYQSYSYIRMLPAEQRQKFLARLEALVNRDFGGLAPNTVLTTCYSARSPA